MNEDIILGLGIIIAWLVSILAGLAITGFVCWGIYKLVMHFL